MGPIEIILTSVICCLFLIFIIHQEILFGKMIRQNNKVLTHADERLDRANKMVLTLAHSADSLAESVSHLKDMMVHLEQVYTSRNSMLSKNYEQLNDAHIKLTARYVQLEDKHEKMITEAYQTLQELARRPTTTNNNNNNLGEI